MTAFYDWMYNILGFFFGPVMYGIFLVVKNYGIAIIFFTIFCRMLLLPSAISQQKNMAKNQRMQFKLRKIQERYKDDKRRLQEETQAFYRREGYNPMSAGCSGSMLLQFPIIFGLIAAIYRPLQYTVRIGANALAVIRSAVETGGLAGLTGNGSSSNLGSMWQLQVVSNFEKFQSYVHDGLLTLQDAALDKLDFSMLQAMVKSGEIVLSEKTVAAIEKASGLAGGAATLGDQLAALGDAGFDKLTGSEGVFMIADVMDKIEAFTHQFSLGAMNLGAVPRDAGGWYYLLPVLAGLASMASSLYTYIRSRKQNPEQGKNPMMGCMTFGMPIFSGFLALGFPAGIALYWIVSSLLAFVQMLVLSKTHKPSKMLGRVMVEETIERRSRENSRRKMHEMQE